jgi:hypothetical protein
VIGYGVFILAQAFLVYMFLAIPLPELLKFAVILIAPSLVSGPAIYWSTQTPDKRFNVWVFIAAAEFHSLCVFLGVTYAATRLKYISAETARSLWPFVIVSLLITSGILWRLSNRKAVSLARR